VHHVTVTGVRGSLRRGYQVAADLGPWTVTRDGPSWSMTATVFSSNAFRVSQRPLVFVAEHAHGAWRWPIQTLQISGASLTAVLGSPEK
jgi:hypothetical protein